MNIRYRNIKCCDMTDDEIQQCAKLFSQNYGVWGKAFHDPDKIGKHILLPSKRLKEMFVDKPDRYVALIYDNNEIIGQAFYLRRKITKFKQYKNKYITWVLQLVVKKEYRGHKFGSKLLHAIWGLSDNFAWGIYTSNPRTVKALENATLRKVYKDKIVKHFPVLKSVAYDLFESQDWLDTMHDCCIDTNFPVDHSHIERRKKEEYPAKDFPLPDLMDSEEWIAFVFSSQKPHPNALNQLELWTETSKDILRQAYEDMDRSSHHWAAHTQHEIDYLVKNNYITKTNEILDLGCGDGRHTIELGKRGYKTTGIDFSEKLINQNKFPIQSLPNIEFRIHDVLEYVPKNKYDVVLCLYDVLGSYTSVADNKKIVKTISQSLIDRGIAVISVMNLHCTLAEFPKNNIVDDIKETKNFFRLIKLPSSNTMQNTGNIFNGKLLLYDKRSGITYHKEQFWVKDNMPQELILAERRFFEEDLLALFYNEFDILDISFVQAGHWDKKLSKSDKKAKEILVVLRKRSFYDKVCHFLKRGINVLFRSKL